MSFAPILSWWDSSNTQQYKDMVLDFGFVPAGGKSLGKEVLIWNNRRYGDGSTDDVKFEDGTLANPAVDVNDTAGLVINLTDENGDPVTDIEVDKWIKFAFYVDTAYETLSDLVSGTQVKAVNMNNAAGVLKGTANSRELTSTSNYSKLKLILTPPGNATWTDPPALGRKVVLRLAQI